MSKDPRKPGQYFVRVIKFFISFFAICLPIDAALRYFSAHQEWAWGALVGSFWISLSCTCVHYFFVYIDWRVDFQVAEALKDREKSVSEGAEGVSEFGPSLLEPMINPLLVEQEAQRVNDAFFRVEPSPADGTSPAGGLKGKIVSVNVNLNGGRFDPGSALVRLELLVGSGDVHFLHEFLQSNALLCDIQVREHGPCQ